MRLDLDNVVARHSTGLGNTYVIPGNNGDCLLVGQSGAGDSTSLRMRDTRLTDCMNNGLTFGSNVSNGSSGPASELSFDIDRSQITANRGYNLRVVNLTALTRLWGKIQNTNLGGAQGTNIAFDQLGSTTDATLDLGGGALGSVGRNCFSGGGQLDAETILFDVVAKNNWWGGPAGPGPGRVVTAGGSFSYAPVLTSRPAGVC